jgi:hypothetical protein
MAQNIDDIIQAITYVEDNSITTFKKTVFHPMLKYQPIYVINTKNIKIYLNDGSYLKLTNNNVYGNEKQLTHYLDDKYLESMNSIYEPILKYIEEHIELILENSLVKSAVKI